MEKVKVGIVGTGFTIGISLQHVKAYLDNPNAKLIAVYDLVKGRAATWLKEKEINGVHVCDSYDELLDLVNAVSICTPNNTHSELAAKALDKGVHVLCEKPISNDAKSTELMLFKAKEHPELVNMTGFCYRGIPAIRYMKFLIDQGKLGRIYSCSHQLGGGRIAAKTKVKREWRMDREQSGSGALADFGSHMLDLTDYLLRPSEGEIVQLTALTNTSITERISEEGAGTLPVTNDDVAAFAVKLKSGVVSTFLSSRIGLSSHRWEIIGEGGILIYSGDDNTIHMVFKEKDDSFHFMKKPEQVEVPEEFRNKSRFHDEIDEFISNILEKRQSERDFERGLYIQNLLDLLDQSAESGKTINV